MTEPSPTSIGEYYPAANSKPQAPSDVAVLITTVLRPSIADAIRSIYAQSFPGTIQIVIGVDVPLHDDAPLRAVLAERPDRVSALVVRLPYSTSVRHGGVHMPMDGGAMRAITALLANAPYLAQLDDDNTWLPPHLELLLQAVRGKTWAHAPRMLVDEETDRDLTVDVWDSVGPVGGRLGGFVDPNCLLIDKVAYARELGRYADTLDSRAGYTLDRLVFAGLQHRPHGRVDQVTVRYRIRRDHVLWRQMIESGRVRVIKPAETG